MIAEEQLAEIEALLAEATPGPWSPHYLFHRANAYFACELRNHAAALIAGCREAARLREENARLLELLTNAWPHLYQEVRGFGPVCVACDQGAAPGLEPLTDHLPQCWVLDVWRITRDAPAPTKSAE